jgi:outer membrane protein assembly factor BamB
MERSLSPSGCIAAVLAMGLAGPVAAQSLGGLFGQAVQQVKQKVERQAGNGANRRTGSARQDARQGNDASAAAAVPVPDDSLAARDSAIARLRSAPARTVCADRSVMGRVYGTTCNGREFPAPPILSAPSFAWQTKPGWWGAWSPFLVGNLMLTGSCNNDDNAGLSALDIGTGKTVWRIGNICAVGNRRGTSGNVGFFELPSGEVLLVYPRDNGEPADYDVVDTRAGRIVRSLKPAANVALRGLGGSFTGVNQSKQDGVSNLIGFSPSLDAVRWRNRGFRLAMHDDDPRYKPTFSPTALTGDILLLSARSTDQPDPPTRQLQAIDVQTGQTLWRNTGQPAVERGSGNGGDWRSDDGTPMVAGGLAIIRVQGLLGPAALGRRPDGDALRAFDARTGAVAWTTRPVRGTAIENRVAVGDVLVAEVLRGDTRELWGYRLADGAPAWRRPASEGTRLLASSGGAFYASERVPAAGKEAGNDDYRVQGFDGQTGTLLWTTTLPGHNLDFDGGWGIEPDPRRRGSQGPSWRIGRDGAIYGVTLTGAFKLQ